MAVTISWEDLDETVIRVTFISRWSWADALEAKETIRAMVEPATDKVSVIICWENENWMPGNYQRNVLNIANETHPNLRLVVIVRKNPVFMQFFRLFASLNGVPFEFTYADSVDAARQLLFPVLVF